MSSLALATQVETLIFLIKWLLKSSSVTIKMARNIRSVGQSYIFPTLVKDLIFSFDRISGKSFHINNNNK